MTNMSAYTHQFGYGYSSPASQVGSVIVRHVCVISAVSSIQPLADKVE